MGKPYRGKYFANRIVGSLGQDEVYFEVKLSKSDISFFNKIIEAYEHMAFVVQVNPEKGIIGLYTTSDQFSDLTQIIKNLPLKVELL